jgi:hypothetical protein
VIRTLEIEGLEIVDGLRIGDWGLGIGDWGLQILGIAINPQSKIIHPTINPSTSNREIPQF